MDLATLLTKVDRRETPTVKAFLDAAALILAGEQQFWGGDLEGVREVRSARLALPLPCRAACASRAPASYALGGILYLMYFAGIQKVCIDAHLCIVRFALLPVIGVQGARHAGRGEAAGGAPGPPRSGGALRGDPRSGGSGAPAARCHARRAAAGCRSPAPGVPAGRQLRQPLRSVGTRCSFCWDLTVLERLFD